MRNWKELKDKEVIIGLVIIIILGVIAISLLVKREIRYQKEKPIAMEEAYEENKMILEEELFQEDVVVETIAESEESEISEESESEEEIALANVQIVTEENSKQIAKDNEEKSIGLYDIFGSEKYEACSLTERKKEDNQLKELYDYWEAYKLDAVADLIRLERLQNISKELKGTNKFYYYGSVDRLGRPSGKGLAVYADNTYYCGEWKEGLRHGKGMWLEIAIYTEDNAKLNCGVIEHSYNGQWSRDLPNGEGQEHFSYDYSILKEEYFNDKPCISNVIGEFKDGYYHGEMYIMTVDEKGESTDWGGTCKNGVWTPIEVGHTSDTVWKAYEEDEQGNSRVHYLLPKDNHSYGIMGLKK